MPLLSSPLGKREAQGLLGRPGGLFFWIRCFTAVLPQTLRASSGRPNLFQTDLSFGHAKDKFARSEFGQLQAGPKGKTQGWVLQRISPSGARTGVQSASRSETDQNIAKLKAEYQPAAGPVISMVSKKKELIGNFAREGHTHTQAPTDALDHDFPSAGEGKLIPHAFMIWPATKATSI